LAFVGILNCVALKAELRDYFNMVVVIFFVGIGSLAFHATLLFHSQLLDEIPMVYGAAGLIFCLLETTNQYDTEKEKAKGMITASVLISYSLLITCWYLLSGNPLIFQVGYTIMAAFLVIAPAFYLPGFTKDLASAKKKAIWNCYHFAIGCYVLGTSIWIFENTNCMRVREWRNTMGLPKFAFQLHAHWHLLTQIASFSYTMMLLYLRRLHLKGARKDLNLTYSKLLGLYPVIVGQTKLE
jgi:dihydroceramidase